VVTLTCTEVVDTELAAAPGVAEAAAVEAAIEVETGLEESFLDFLLAWGGGAFLFTAILFITSLAGSAADLVDETCEGFDLAALQRHGQQTLGYTYISYTLYQCMY